MNLNCGYNYNQLVFCCFVVLWSEDSQSIISTNRKRMMLFFFVSEVSEQILKLSYNIEIQTKRRRSKSSLNFANKRYLRHWWQSWTSNVTPKVPFTSCSWYSHKSYQKYCLGTVKLFLIATGFIYFGCLCKSARLGFCKSRRVAFQMFSNLIVCSEPGSDILAVSCLRLFGLVFSYVMRLDSGNGFVFYTEASHGLGYRELWFQWSNGKGGTGCKEDKQS